MAETTTTTKGFPHPPALTSSDTANIKILHEYIWSLFRSAFLEGGGIVQGEDLGGLAGVDAVATDDIQDRAVTLAKLQNIATRNMLGRTSSGTGIVELVAFTLAGLALLQAANAAAQRTALGLGALAVLSSIDTGNLADNAVTLAKLQNFATKKLLARLSGGTGDPELVDFSIGTCTLAAAATTTVNETAVTANSRVFLFPTNAAAATLMSVATSLFHSASVAGASFDVTTANGAAAAGTETFNYLVIG